VFQYFRVGLTKLGVFASQPIAFIIVFCYVAAWLALNPETFDWHAVATVATWFMTLIIQRAGTGTHRRSMPGSTNYCGSTGTLAAN
jgi:hypothetical protein